jgi:hypothetical protein
MMNKRIKFFQEALTDFRQECIGVGIPSAERRFLEFIKNKISPKLWERIAPTIDRVHAKLPHHLSTGYNKKRDQPIIKKWLLSRYVFMFGELVCDNCGSKDGKLFTKFMDNPGTGFQGLWLKYCSDSCSKSSDEATLKREATCMEKYGVANVSHSEDFKQFMRDKNEKISKGENGGWTARNEKTRKTLERKHGTTKKAYAKAAELRRETCIIKFGGPAPTSSKEVRNKVVATNLERRGVTNPSKDPTVMAKIMSSWKNRKSLTVDGVTFDSLQGYEPQVIENLVTELGVPVGRIRRADIAIPYNFEGRDRHYHPDFIVRKNKSDILIEVKSIYTSAIIKDTTNNHGYYNQNRAKINACVKLGYETRFIIWDNNECFIWKGMLPKNKNKVVKAFTDWQKSLS